MKRKLIAVAAVCAACALAIAATALAGSSKAKRASTSSSSTQPGPGGPGGPHGPGGHAVHSVSVVLNKEGTAYITETTDDGTVKSIDETAGTITLVEGTKSVTYQTPTITIPSGSTITLDGKSSTLGAIAVGDRVSVRSSSEGTSVFAADSSFQPQMGTGHGGGSPPAAISGEGG